MDLVASYDSDIEELSDRENPKTAPMKSDQSASSCSKSYDIIDLGSDSDEGTTTPSENTMPSSDSNPVRNSAVHPPKSATKDKVVTIKKELNEKRSDYLHLDNSESEEDAPAAPDKIESLKNSAAVLSDSPCGPGRPNQTDLDKLRIANQPVEKNIPAPVTGQSLPESVPVTSMNLLGNNAPQPPSDTIVEVPDMFKEDERVLEASRKNMVCRIPKKIVQSHAAHESPIMSLNWCIPQYSHLFLSASLDGTLKIWDLYHRNPVQKLNVGTGLSAAKWSLDGGQVVTGGISKKALVYDVQTGKKIVDYNIYNYVNSIEVHPYMEDVFLVGTRNAILGFDIRVNTTFPIRCFFSNCKEVLDIVFLDENEFVCSSNIVSHDSENRTIMVWDFSSGALLSNQIYLERYTCPSLKVHPEDSSFIAQTNGDYIAAFSTARPYKIKNKKYSGHSVAGYNIECDISPDGKYVVSGDSQGHVFFYNYANTAVVHKPQIKKNCPTNRIKWHPAFSNIIISSNYDGLIQIWK